MDLTCWVGPISCPDLACTQPSLHHYFNYLLMTSSMPGAFPLPELSREDLSQAANVLHQEHEASFQRKEANGAKTGAQRHLMGQLDSLCYLLIGYQLIKHCHSACLFPVAAHWLVQLPLDFQVLSSPHGGGQLLFLEALTRQEEQATAMGLPFDREKVASSWLSRICICIYLKFVAVVVYHVLFIIWWVQPIADNGRLALLENGAWYSTSFIGEMVPTDYNAGAPWWLRLWKLGLFELILTDTLILAVQLVLYQAIYIQLTALPRGQRLGEDEVCILRCRPGGAGGEPTLCTDGTPDILHVKLYETLMTAAYIAQD